MSICSVDDINECDWKPMPLIQGIKHVFSHNSPILKLPNYISILETKLGSVRICKLYLVIFSMKLIIASLYKYVSLFVDLCDYRRNVS